MSIKLLLVDGSDVMRSAIRRLLKNELDIEVIGTATSFAETLVLTAALKPDVLLMDPHMPDEREYTPKLVKSQILLHTKCIVAMSLWNDADTRTLAETFGAHVLLDKMNLYSFLLVIVAAHSLVSFVFLHSDEISLFKVAVNRYFSTSC